MYSVYAGNTCIYDDTSSAKELRLINPVLDLGDNAAGSFKMTVPVTNAGYQIIDRLTTYIRVEKDGQEMWEGRIIDEKIDYWKNRTLTCEGELAYLNDSTQPPAEYHNMTVRGFLETLLNIHNAKVSVDKQFQVGAVTVTDPNDSLYRYTNYEKTIECINEKLVESLGGHLSVRKENGVRYLDYLADKQSTNTQLIEFGTNLLDYAASFDMTDYATVIVPLGEKLEESPIAALEAYLTVSSVNEGSIYVQNAEAVQNFGWIEKVVHFDRVTVASNLLRKAQQYLSELQFDNMVLEVKAVDLHYMNPDIEGVKLSDQIRVISTPHGLNKVFPVSKLSIPLDQPENTMFTLGTNIKMSLTEANNKTNNEIIKQIEAIPTKQSVLAEAQDNAESIMDLATNGFVTITKDQNGSEAIYISDTQDLSQATKWWRWNANGLAYYNTNMGSSNPLVAMTMDGAIVADRITAGTLRADLLDAVRIKASTFYLENESDPSQTAESLGSVIQRFTLADGQLSSEISGLSQVAVKTVEVYYALGTSSTVAPTTGWSTTAPSWDPDKYMWQKTLTIFADDTQASPHRSWSTPTCIQGGAGANTAIVYLYRRSATAPTIDWQGDLTYYFTGQNAHHLNAVPSGWSESIPASDGNPLYVTAATAYANTGSDTIAYTEWSAPVKMAEDGTSGNPGTNSATVFLYQRAASIPSKPSGNLEYTFSDGSLTGTLGSWTQQIPTSDGNPCYVIQATAVSTSTTDTIANTEWSSQRVLVEDGSDGDPGVGISRVVPEYYLSTSASTQSGGSWSTTCPAWQSGKYIWTRSHVYYDNNTDSTTTPVLDNAVNGLGQSYTEIKQSMSNITLRAVSGTPKTDVGTLASSYPSGSYAFTRTNDGYYTSSNAGVSTSYSYGTINFNFAQDTLVSFDCISDGKVNSAFGIISELDTQLVAAAGEDVSGVFYSFREEASSSVKTLSMMIPSGQHYITIKYKRDDSVVSGEDCFKINPYTGTGEHGAMISIDSNDGIVSSAANIVFNGLVTFSDLSGNGTTQINGGNIMTNTLKVKEIYHNSVDNYLTFSSDIEILNGNNYLNINIGSQTATTYYGCSVMASADIFRFQGANGTGSVGTSRYLDIAPESEAVLPKANSDWWLGSNIGSRYFGRAYVSKYYFDDSASYLYVNHGANKDVLYFHDDVSNDDIRLS